VPVTDHDPFDRVNGDLQGFNIANNRLRVGSRVEEDGLGSLAFDLGGLRAVSIKRRRGQIEAYPQEEVVRSL